MSFKTFSSYDKVKLQTVGIHLIATHCTTRALYCPAIRDKVGLLSIYSMAHKMFGKGSRVLLLQELLKDWPCTFTGEKLRIPITGITENSKDVKTGFIFVARKGGEQDGALYIEEAIRQGAAAIVVDRTTLFGIPIEMPVVVVPDCRLFLSYASARLSGNPSEGLTVIAVTGTNGKTTVSHFIGQLLERFGERVAVIGTLGVFIDGLKVDYALPQMTTLPAEYLHPLLKDCANQGVTHIVLEASSLGLSGYRLEHCEIDIGVLLNIGADHYDEHGGRQPYLDAKKKLVMMAKQLIVNRDDQDCMEMINGATEKSMTFGADSKSDIRLKVEEDKMVVIMEDEIEKINRVFLEEFNRMNALAAISVMQILSYKLKAILPHLASLQLPEGRMQRIERNGVTVVIDYAHTPDALEVVLQSIGQVCKGKIITVFGCGGNRDKGKRGEMGEVAAFYSSSVLVTSDNPRSEDPEAIIADIVKGFDEGCTAIQVEPNREYAIRKAIVKAKAGDVVLIAGKGHEKTQHIGDEVLPFSDIAIVKQTLFEGIQN